MARRPPATPLSRGTNARRSAGDGDPCERQPGRQAKSLAARLPAGAGCVARARRSAREVLADLPGVAEVAALLVSELATNAVRHGGGGFELSIARDETRVRVEIRDTTGLPPIRRQPRQEEPGGRGLLIVDRLATAWGVEPSEGGKTVWFQLDLPDRPT